MNETQHIASTISQGEKEIGAGNEIRTRDPDLGKVVLYQLSYSRFIWSLTQVRSVESPLQTYKCFIDSVNNHKDYSDDRGLLPSRESAILMPNRGKSSSDRTGP